ncbi:MAG: tryptophan 7-halogenase [Pedosphaera parvula]|nr:tryptophan 7-halogenase [Pedosphaera parvula]
MRERMEHARLVNDIQTTTDFSYYNKRFVGDRLLRVGDAAGFMDPIFSAGVYLAMYSAKLAAEAVETSLQRGDDGARRFRRYEKQVRRAMEVYFHMVHHFYTTPFMEIFLEPRPKWNLPAAVNAVLAGETKGGWSFWWRLQVFFWIVRVQRFWALVPRISFD